MAVRGSQQRLAHAAGTGQTPAGRQAAVRRHGEPGGQELLGEQQRYIRVFQDAVRELSHGRTELNEDAKNALAERMTAIWLEAPLTELITMSADPILAELANHRS